MAATADRLSSLDCFFLAAERAHTHMHIGATLLFEAGPLARKARRVDVDALRRHVGCRLHRIPRYRQRLARTPLEGRPIWVDDERFWLDAHVRHIRLRKSPNDRHLREAIGEVLSRPLDRDRPLWELWIFDGFEENRFAVVTKVHHCMADGLAGVEQLAALLGPAPDSTDETPPPWLPRSAPQPLELLGEELASSMQRASAAAAWLGEGLRSPSRTWKSARQGTVALVETARSALTSARSTPLNHPLGAERRFEWLAMSLGELRQVKRRLGGTLNDVVLATVAGALRRYLGRRGTRLDDGEIRAAVPVSMRDSDSSAGNQVSLWVLPLPVDEPDARARFQRIRDAVAERKASGNAGALYSLVRLGDAVGPALLEAGVRLLDRLLPFNLIVTNVPGPQFPLWMNGARLLAAYPAVPLFENQGLGIALFSYDGTLYWGFLAEPSVVPDLDEFIYSVAASFCELLEQATDPEALEEAPAEPFALSATA